ncbi:hypothetical protein M413DRAFT_128865 [Hebeloma cylindrosporum]|uniref:Uncharacterized protein n=1 Tax=Hebeloma cylindrosporum TaxID=76867 RepID=A0A0C3CD83_HEBCY|nr:hypothetical protein M413DRAFT_128865 [Hebeloma cylindrosporum h7]
MGVPIPIYPVYPGWPRERGGSRNRCTIQACKQFLVVLPLRVRVTIRQKQHAPTRTLEDIMPKGAASAKGASLVRQKCLAVHRIESRCRHDDDERKKGSEEGSVDRLDSSSKFFLNFEFFTGCASRELGPQWMVTSRGILEAMKMTVVVQEKWANESEGQVPVWA